MTTNFGPERKRPCEEGGRSVHWQVLRGHTGVAPTQCDASALHLSCHNFQKEWHLFPKSEESLWLWLLQAEGFVLFFWAFCSRAATHSHPWIGDLHSFPPSVWTLGCQGSHRHTQQEAQPGGLVWLSSFPGSCKRCVSSLESGLE